MLRKSFPVLLLCSVFLSCVTFAQRLVTIKVLDQDTGLPVKDVMIGGSAAASEEGILRVMVDPGDTLTISTVDYPLKKIVVGNESELTVTMSKVIDNDSVFTVVDESAEFPGGMVAYYKCVKANLKYPGDAVRDRVEGKVFVEFIIAKDGTIEKESVRAIAGPDPRLNAEAVRVARASPSWLPGKKNGENVHQMMVLPYSFRLDKKKKG